FSGSATTARSTPRRPRCSTPTSSAWSPITTPAYSPESNDLAEAFVGTFKRDYLGDADLRDAETVLASSPLEQKIGEHSSCGKRPLPNSFAWRIPLTSFSADVAVQPAA